MKILITGINGFVGSALYKALCGMNHEIFGMDISSDSSITVKVNIADSNAVQDAVLDISPDFIFHLVAISRVDIRDPKSIFNINVNGTLNLLSACLKLGTKPKVLCVSSSQVYGIVEKEKQPINEGILVNPVNLYGASKAAAENLATAFYHDFDLPTVIARPFNHTGKGQAVHFVIPKLVQAFREKQRNIRLGNMEIYRDYLDVRDVVDAYIKIMQDFHPGQVYNISSGIAVHIPEIISMIGDLSGHRLEVISDKELLRNNEIKYAKGDSSKIMKELGWKPRYELMETLRWMLE